MKDFESLVAAKKWTELLKAIPANRTVPLIFPDGRAMESFKATAVLSNRRGESDVYYSVRMDYRQKIVTIISKERDNGTDATNERGLRGTRN